MIVDKKVLYSIPLIIGKVDDIENEKIIKNALKNKEKKIRDSKLSTGFEDSELDRTDELIKLFNKIQDDMWDEKGLDLDVTGWWGHIQEPNMSTHLHNHNGTLENPIDIGGVYYPHNPHKDSGEIVFQWKDIRQKYDKSQYSIKPEMGMYVLFPCNLNHWVTRNTSTEDRISISFNMLIVNEDKRNQWESL